MHRARPRQSAETRVRPRAVHACRGMLDPMTHLADDIADSAPDQTSAPDRGPLVGEPGRSVCPFLRSHDGAWSSVVPSRDLRCWAVRPAALPAVQKQRQVCTGAAHVDCATYGAAMAADLRVGGGAADGPTLWPAASPVPVTLESVHTRPGVGVGSPRVGGQALLVGLMVVALVVLVVARTTPMGGASAVPSGSAPPPSAAVSSAFAGASAAPSASVTPSPTAVATTAPSASASQAASPSPVPSASALRTYRVRAGDTIASIAAKYGTTVKAIVAANKITDPHTIHVGQVLIIP